MSITSEPKSEGKVKLEKSLEAALQRVVILEQQKHVPLLDHILTLPSQKEEILAAQIHARKKRHASRQSTERSIPENEREELHQDIEDRLCALQNHRIAKNALQSAVLNIQMQESVREELQKTDLENTVGNFTTRGELLSHCGTNLFACKELAALVKEMKELESEIFHLHPLYSSLLKKIRSKWEILEDRLTPSQASMMEEENKLGLEMERTKRREDKIQLLIVMIQGLLSTSGFQWGAYEYYLQLMLYCDAVIMHQDMGTLNAIKRKILEVQNTMETK